MTDQRSDRVSHGYVRFTRPDRLPATSEDVQLLAGATRHSIDHAGTALAAWSWGVGPSVLLLHGWESRASHMAAFVPALVKAGLRAVALDAPAHGDSHGELTDVVDYGNAVITVARHFGGIDAVIAHSLGSAASVYAYANGVRVRASVQLCGPASLRRAIHFLGTALDMTALEIAQLETLIVERIGAPLDVMEVLNQRHGMTHPVMILHDPDDRKVPVAESRALSEIWPGAVLRLVPGVGHRRILQAPHIVAGTVDFIATALAAKGH